MTRSFEPTGPLSDRQMEVAQLVATGHTDKQIAATLGICVQRVGQIVEAIGVKLRLNPTLDTRLLIAALGAGRPLEIFKVEHGVRRS